MCALAKCSISILILIFATTFYTESASAGILGAQKEAFMRRFPCPSPKQDCYYDWTKPKNDGTPLSTTDFIYAENIQKINDDDWYVRYRSMSDPRCQQRSCIVTMNRSQLNQPINTAAGVASFLTLGIRSAGVDYPACSTCGGPEEQAEKQRYAEFQRTGRTYAVRIPIPPLGPARRPPYSMTAAESFLKWDSKRKMECYGRRYLRQSLPLLRAAENAFAIPAASLACLIGKESKWDPSQRSPTGYVGLGQTNQDAINVMQGRLDPKSASYDPDLRRMWDKYAPGVSPTEITLANIHRRPPPDERDRATRDRMAKISIGYVALYLKQQMISRFETAKARYGIQTAIALDGSPTLLAMAYVGYNAGNGNANQILPEWAYRGYNPSAPENRPPNKPRPNFNDLRWAQNLLPKASKATIEQAEDYVSEIHRCENNTIISATPGSQPAQPKDECGL